MCTTIVENLAKMTNLAKVMDLLFDNFLLALLKLTNQNTGTVGGGVVKCHVGFLTNNNSAPHSPCILIGQK